MTFTANLARYRALCIAILAAAMIFSFAPAAFADDVLGIEAASEGTVLGTDAELIPIVNQVINVALGLLGIVAVVIILIAGFKWMTAGGNEEQVAEAKKRISQGVIGLAVILAAYAIANFVISELGSATGVEGFEAP